MRAWDSPKFIAFSDEHERKKTRRRIYVCTSCIPELLEQDDSAPKLIDIRGLSDDIDEEEAARDHARKTFTIEKQMDSSSSYKNALRAALGDR